MPICGLTQMNEDRNSKPQASRDPSALEQKGVRRPQVQVRVVGRKFANRQLADLLDAHTGVVVLLTGCVVLPGRGAGRLVVVAPWRVGVDAAEAPAAGDKGVEVGDRASVRLTRRGQRCGGLQSADCGPNLALRPAVRLGRVEDGVGFIGRQASDLGVMAIRRTSRRREVSNAARPLPHSLCSEARPNSPSAHALARSP